MKGSNNNIYWLYVGIVGEFTDALTGKKCIILRASSNTSPEVKFSVKEIEE